MKKIFVTTLCLLLVLITTQNFVESPPPISPIKPIPKPGIGLVVCPPNTIVVGTTLRGATQNLDDARFRVEKIGGGPSWTAQGRNWSTTAPPGKYKITFYRVEGYGTPSPQTGELQAGKCLRFTAVYEPHTCSIKISPTNPEETDNISATIKYSLPSRCYNVTWDGTTFSAGGKITIKTRETYKHLLPCLPRRTLRQLEVNIGVLAAGSYTITVKNSKYGVTQCQKTFSVAGAAPSEEYGMIMVTTNLDTASFTIQGPETYSGSGKSWGKTNVPTGTYTIIFNPVSGYETPEPQTKQVKKDLITTFHGEYTQEQLTGAILVITNMENASFTITGPTTYYGMGMSWMEEEAPVGEYTITYNPVEGYETPSQETKTVLPGETTIFQAEYKPHVEEEKATIQVNTNLDQASYTITGPEGFQEVGTGKTWRRTDLTPGEYTITYNPVEGYETPSQETKIVEKGGTGLFTGIYKPKTCSISVVSDPSGAEVYLDGSHQGQTPLTIGDVEPGVHTVRCSLQGYNDYQQETHLEAGQQETITCNFSEETGGIAVTTNNQDATFEITGPTTLSGSGLSKSWIGVPTGEYTITYGDIPGYTTPKPETRTLEPDGIVIFEGIYTPTAEGATPETEAGAGETGVTETGEALVETGVIVVQTNRPDASFMIQGAAEYSGRGKTWTQSDAPVGEYTITYNTLSGIKKLLYKTPPEEKKTLAPGESIRFRGDYKLNTALIAGVVVVIAALTIVATHTIARGREKGPIPTGKRYTKPIEDLSYLKKHPESEEDILRSLDDAKKAAEKDFEEWKRRMGG